MANVIDLDTTVNMGDLLEFTQALRLDYAQLLRHFDTLADHDHYLEYTLRHRHDLPDWAQHPVLLPRDAAWRMEIDMNDYEQPRYRRGRGRSRSRERGGGCGRGGPGFGGRDGDRGGGGGGGGGPGLHYHNDRHYHDHHRWGGGGMDYEDFLADGVGAAFERSGWGGGHYGGYGGWRRRRYW
ncbi:hypothetical protein DL546_003937 [Coniochaeta pulveracea]|uniref:Uncharacterized protein n=1 Tax=Coniochaeta pulveracea TaxID=177199 RepID=A0A420Y9C4_9PEZI|nr:hypothetical protein DL546_003937 [Coniochaeta pulveracea]